MQILDLKKEDVLKAAQIAFPNNVIEVDTTDFYLPDIEKGSFALAGVDHPFYVSTHYVYEDHLVKENQTRYKVAITTITLKHDPYEVVYHSNGNCFVAMLDDTMQFIPYPSFYETIKKYINFKKDEEKDEV